MTTDYIKIYLEQNKTLIQTMNVKMLSTIEGVNTYVRDIHGERAVINGAPETWKYYMNIAGEYHPTDTLMDVVSLDTLERINFTRQNLELHRRTREAYSFNSNYYKQLVKRYPMQELLIKGILYPCDINKAIEAKEGEILSYPSELVEEQETTLIPELSNWLQSYVARWHVKAFGLTDTLYNTAQQAIMFLNAYPKLLNMRLARCKTIEAHSFHIRQYLGSHDELDRYLPYLTLKQKLWLYRNIRYVERNSGKKEVFKDLVDILLTERNLPLSEYTVRQLSSVDDNLRTEVIVRRKAVNTEVNLAEIDYLSKEELYNKEEFTTYGNYEHFIANKDKISHKLLTINSSVVQTKDLESDVIDYTDAVPDPLEQVLLREWCSMVYHNRYTAVISFKNPRTSELYSLTAKDAFIYFLYIKCSQAGIILDRPPTIINYKFKLDPLPTKEQLLSLVDQDVRYDVVEEADYLLKQQPIIEDCVSVAQFYEQTYKIYQETLRQWYYLSNVHDIHMTGYVEKMMDRLYGIEYCNFDEGEDMVSWLVSRELPVYDLAPDEADDVMTEMFQAATGITDNSVELLKNIQKAMLGIMRQLSSYSIQLLNKINNSNIILLNWKTLRFGDDSGRAALDLFFPLSVNYYDPRYSGSSEIHIDYNLIELNDDKAYDLRGEVGYEGELDIGFDIILNSIDPKYAKEDAYKLYDFLPIEQFYIDISYEGKDYTLQNDRGFIGYEYYLNLTDEQKLNLVSVY